MKIKPKIKNIEVGDFLSFRASDGNYRVIFCVAIQIKESPFYFHFAATTINSKNKPHKEEIFKCGFYGIVNRKNLYFKTEHNSASGMWKDHRPEIDPFLVGVYELTIWRKDFMRFRDAFEYIDNISIHENLHLKGNGGMNASSLEALNKLFLSNINEIMVERRQKAIVISSIFSDCKNQGEQAQNKNSFWEKLMDKFS